MQVVPPVLLRVGERHQHRLLRPPDKGIRQLGTEIVVDDSIRNLLPAVQHIPPYDAGLVPFGCSEPLDEVFERLRLRHLTHAGVGVDAVRHIPEHMPHLRGHQPDAVAEGVGLVELHGRLVCQPCRVGRSAERILCRAFVIDRPELILRDVLPQGGGVRTAVIAGLRSKVAGCGAVEIALEVVARSPEVILRGSLRPARKRHLIHIRRGGQVGTGKVLRPQDVTQ